MTGSPIDPTGSTRAPDPDSLGRPPRLPGRVDELDALAEFVDSVARRRPAVLIVDGPAGSGKTTLLRELVRMARRQDVRVLTAAAALTDAAGPGVVAQLTAPLAAGDPASAPTLSAVVSGGPVVVVVDNAQRADAASLRELADFARGLNEVPVGIALALRREEPVRDPDAVDELRHTLGAVVLSPRPLGPNSIRAALERDLTALADDAFVRACRAATRGNPFLLAELAAELRSQQVAPDAAESVRVADIGPLAVAHSIEAMIRYIDPDALPVARALAVLAHRAGPAEIGVLCELDEPTAAGALATLTRATLLRPGTGEYLHPTVRRALYLATPSEERQRLHRRAARLLAARPGTDPQLLAAHLAAFGETVDPEVVELLDRVADEAAAQGYFDVAARCLAQALPGSLSPTGRAERAGRLAVYLERAGAGPAPHLLRHAYDLAPDLAQRRRIARYLLQTVAAADGVPAAISLAHEIGDPVPEDRAALGLLHADSVARSRAWTGGGGAAALLASWRGADRAECVRLAGTLLTEQPLRAVPSAEQLAAALALLYAEEWTVLGQLLDAARRGGEYGAELHLLAAHLALRRGDVAAAGDAVDAAETTVAAARQAPVALSLAATRAEVLLDLGNLDEAAETLRRTGVLDREPDGRWSDVHLLTVRGRLRISDGNGDRGIDDLRAAGALLARFGVENPAVSSWRAELAGALTARGELSEAQKLTGTDRAAARRWGAPRALGIAERAAALAGPADERAELLAHVVAIQQDGGSELERARTLVDLGLARVAEGKATAGRDALRAGLDLAQRCAADALADRAHRALVAAGARPRRRAQTGVDALTASERRIVELAAAGRTNREISTELYVTQRTVELHLTNAYRKLGIAHRHELLSAIRR